MKILSAKLGYLKESKNIFNKEFKYSGSRRMFTVWTEGTPLDYRNTSLDVYTMNLSPFARRKVCGPAGSDCFSFFPCVFRNASHISLTFYFLDFGCTSGLVSFPPFSFLQPPKHAHKPFHI